MFNLFVPLFVYTFVYITVLSQFYNGLRLVPRQIWILFRIVITFTINNYCSSNDYFCSAGLSLVIGKS